MAHTHAYLQEEEKGSSIEETITSFYDCEEGDLRELCPQLSRIESLEVRYIVDGLIESHVRS